MGAKLTPAGCRLLVRLQCCCVPKAGEEQGHWAVRMSILTATPASPRVQEELRDVSGVGHNFCQKTYGG